MKASDYFNLGCKLFGVYFFFLSVPLFVAAISTFYSGEYSSPDFEKYLRFHILISRVLPFFYVFIGVMLIKNSEKIFSFAYRDYVPDIDKNSEKFRLFLKMLGIYLFSQYIPELIESVSSYLTYSNAPKVFHFFTQQRYANQHFFPSIIAIFLGVYLIRDGEFFVKMGFKLTNDNKKIVDA